MGKYENTSANMDKCQLQDLSVQNHPHVNQSQSGLWLTERRKRVTASNFGSIVGRKPTIPVSKCVRTFLYSRLKGTRHTRNGLFNERSTIEEYKMKIRDKGENVKLWTSSRTSFPCSESRWYCYVK